MFRNYLKTAFRNLYKNKLYTGINMVGLTVGLTACLLIGVFIAEELSYDTFHSKANRIVRATMEYKSAETINQVATTGTKVGPLFKRTFPAIEDYARTFITHGIIKSNDKIFDESRILYADPAFFNIFSFDIKEGKVSTALDAPDKIVLTESMAKKYFGKESAINKTLTVAGKLMTVSAICADVPSNSQIKFDFATAFLNLGNAVQDESWWTANWVTFFLLKKEKDIAPLEQQIAAYMNQPAVRAEAGMDGTNYLTYHLEPLTKVHLYSALNGFEPNGKITYIYLFAVIALLIVMIACANYSNLITAQSATRMGEIGMRKVLGASKKHIFFQFIGESVLLTMIAALLAVGLSVVLMPYFNNLTGKQFSTASLRQFIPMTALIVLAILVSVVAGIYPALIVSGTQVISVVKKGFSFTGGSDQLRKILIVVQFSVSVFLIIYTTILLQQLKFMQTKDLGYNKEQVLVLPIGGQMLSDFDNLKKAWLQVPGIKSVTASYETPEYVQWGDGIVATDEKGKQSVSLKAMPVDIDFTQTMGMKIVAGRDFQESDFAIMDTLNNYANYHQPYVINEALAKKIGWKPEEAIGKIIDKGVSGPVVGVVKDFNFNSLHESIGPLLIFLNRDLSRNFLIRVNEKNLSATLANIGTVWKERIPERPFNYRFLDDDYNKLYLAEQRTASLFSVASGLAIVLACLGLFGLAAYTTLRRTKEIGIRRVMGANSGSLVLLLSKNFIQLVAMAVIIALPLAWWAGYMWLQNFAYRTGISWWIFIGAAVMALAITLITVGIQVLKAVLSNPVKNLRIE